MRPRVNRGGAVVEGVGIGVPSSSDDSDESGEFSDFNLSSLLTKLFFFQSRGSYS